jgi:hypothetical protein
VSLTRPVPSEKLVDQRLAIKRGSRLITVLQATRRKLRPFRNVPTHFVILRPAAVHLLGFVTERPRMTLFSQLVKRQ